MPAAALAARTPAAEAAAPVPAAIAGLQEPPQLFFCEVWSVVSYVFCAVVSRKKQIYRKNIKYACIYGNL